MRRFSMKGVLAAGFQVVSLSAPAIAAAPPPARHTSTRAAIPHAPYRRSEKDQDRLAPAPTAELVRQTLASSRSGVSGSLQNLRGGRVSQTASLRQVARDFNATRRS